MHFLILIAAVLALRSIANAGLAYVRAVQASTARIEKCLDRIEAYLTAQPDAERRELAELIQRENRDVGSGAT